MASSALSHRESGSGPVVVLLHAFPFDSEMWSAQLKELASSYRVIAPDFPGFGDSPVEPGIGIDGMAGRVRDLLDTLKVQDRIVLAGLSMGGYVALSFVRQFPERLRGLILADTKAEADDETARAGRDRAMVTATKEGAAAVVEPLMHKLIGPVTQNEKKSVVESALKMAKRQRVEGIVGALKAMRDREDERSGLVEISVPTLLIVGEEDAVTPPEKSQDLHEAIPNSQFVIIPRVGHLSNMEAAGAFNDTLRTFLSELPRDDA